MQWAHRPVHSDVQAEVATIAEKDERPTGWMNGAVAGDEQIGSEQIFVELKSLLQMS
jgi:hypothetical protein